MPARYEVLEVCTRYMASPLQSPPSKKNRPLDAGENGHELATNLALSPIWAACPTQFDGDWNRNMDKQDVAGKPPQWKCVLVVSKTRVSPGFS